ncbi:MAG: radical SAM protein [Planctomycetes bacterium]|nr:radical SAM protein [Planctomycetota bacterium]
MPTNEPSQAVSLRVSVTDRCQLRCRYCAPARQPSGHGTPDVPGGDAAASPADAPHEPHAAPLALEEILRLVRFLKERFGLHKVHLTGGEPLLRPDLPRLVSLLAAEAPPDLALTTNGQRLAEMAADLRLAGLPRINVSLDSLDRETYRRLTRGGRLDDTLAGIEAARREGLSPVRLNMVVLRGVNDHETADVVRWGLERGCQVRLLELMPIGVARADFRERFVPSAEARERLAGEFDLRPLGHEPGASSRRWLARGRRGLSGIVGFISPCSDVFCGGCRRLRLMAGGRLLGCLARGRGIDIRPLLALRGADAERGILRAVNEALASKRGGRPFAAERPMIAVGG